MIDVKADLDLARKHGLTEEEYGRICAHLGREPNLTELGLFGVMWSEHCSYKNSKSVLKRLPTEGPGVLVRAGEENAGVVDIGDGWVAVFKIESHNHPSAVEPFQGAATGVGGIIRDIFTMGARPVLCMNSLRFGRLEEPRSRAILRGVVEGIAHYGNCMGIPTVGGEVYFDSVYEGNPLVNVLCLGIARKEDLIRARADTVGDEVFYVGASTGRDGLAGASFASRELSEDSSEDRPAVQVGNPFLEKLLLEACLEAAQTGALRGMQDMGAAGLTCSTCETASRGGRGIEVHLDRVPRRETGMTPYEIMLSESQERMLIIVKRGAGERVERVFRKWDLHAERIGEITHGDRMQIFEGGARVADVPAKALTDDAPVYEREAARPAYLERAQALDLASVKIPKDLQAVLLKLLDEPTIASKAWIYEQYDYMVRTDTVFLPGHDAALIRVKGTAKGIALSTDGNGLYGYLDPREGGRLAVVESARNVACTGARPVAVTNCLNFGNPMKPEVMWTFKEAVEGVREACLALETPVTGGNVSFYNESAKGAIDPTPIIGMLGILEDIEARVPSFFRSEGDVVVLIGETANELGGTQYLLHVHGLRAGLPPRVDLAHEKNLIRFLRLAARDRLLASAHDCSEGGLAVAVAECAIGSGLGVKADLSGLRKGELRDDALLFGESQGRVVVSVHPQKLADFERLLGQSGLPSARLGTVSGGDIALAPLARVGVEEASRIYREALGKRVRS